MISAGILVVLMILLIRDGILAILDRMSLILNKMPMISHRMCLILLTLDRKFMIRDNIV